MDIIISQLPYMGWTVEKLDALPKEYGIEVFIECGSDYFWRHVLKMLMKDRDGRLSVHGPFVQLNLADKHCDFEAVKESYRWCFDICNQFNAAHCVCHPHAEIPSYPGYRMKDGQKLALERTLVLNQMAKEAGVQMLVENMPYINLVFEQEDFVEIFGGAPELEFLIDVGHAMLNRWDITQVQAELGRRIRAYHIHENKGDFDAHLKVGEGPLDWQKFFADYKTYTPDARLVLEYASGPLSAIIDNIALVKSYL